MGIKEALQYIVGMGKAEVIQIRDDMYTDKEVHLITPHIPKASPLNMSTLTSLVEYIHSNADKMSEKMLVHIVSPEEVHLLSCLNKNREREVLVKVKAQTPDFAYERFVDHEAFTISVQSKFMDDAKSDKAILLQFAGTVESGSVAQYGDDGITQKATVKTGIASKTDAIIPNPVNLKPFRTFVEVEQPMSAFVFRMKEGRMGGVECALFEADGGAWKNEAMDNIHNFLVASLEDKAEIFTVIS